MGGTCTLSTSWSILEDWSYYLEGSFPIYWGCSEKK